MAIPGNSARVTANSVGTARLSIRSDGGINYYPNSPGTVPFEIGSGCPESKAAGGAVALVVADKLCQQVQGLRIIIGDTYESIHSGFDMVNFNFHTNGQTPRVASTLSLSGPVT